MSTSSAGGSSSAAATRNTTEVWYIMFRGDLTGNTCATVAAVASSANAIQSLRTSGTWR